MNANKTQIGGSHYQSEYQHWDFVRLCLGNRYLEGCVTKYVARWRKKNGLQDLMKALHYLDKIIELFGGEQYESGINPDPLPEFRATEFARLNALGSKETYIICSLTYWNNEFVLQEIREQLLELIKEAEADQRRLDGLKAGASYGGIGGGPGVRALLAEGVAAGEIGADPGIEVGGTRHGYGKASEDHGDEPGAGYVDQG